jgi:hypothetical protein
MVLIWFCYYLFLFNCNEVVFRGGVFDVGRVVDLAVLRSWCWVSARASCFYASLFEWSMSPVQCLKGL